MLNSKPLRILLASALQTAFWLAVIFLDPFGSSTAADKASEDVYLRLFGTLYPDGKRENIQIVILREHELPYDFTSQTWPPQFTDYKTLLKKILQFEPKGVFVDLFFRPDRANGRDPKDLKEYIDELKGRPPNSPPVVFADLLEKTNPSKNSPGSQIACDADDKNKDGEVEKDVTYAWIRCLPFANATVMRALAEFPARDHQYVLRVPHPANTKDDPKGITAAAALYNAVERREGRPGLDLSSDDPFLVGWSSVVSPTDAVEPKCAPIVNTWASRSAALLTALRVGIDTKYHLLAPAGPSKGWDQLQPCPHHRVTTARMIAALPKEQVSQIIRGKYVLIGADIVGSDDLTHSPVHGTLPGIHLHAAALDNFLTFKHPPFLSDKQLVPVQALLIFITAILGLYWFDNWPEPKSRRQALRAIGIRVAAWLALATSILAALLLANVGPHNWGSILAVAAALFFGGAFNELYVFFFGSSKVGVSKERQNS